MTDIKQLSIHDYPWLVEDGLVPNINELGVVMMKVKVPDDLFEFFYGDDMLSPDDLVDKSDSEKFWVKGDVREDAHITILSGLLTPAYEQKEILNRLMLDWVPPKMLNISSCTKFPDPSGSGEYVAIVALVDEPEQIKEARGRLGYLPHVNTFQEYKPHVTLAYVKPEVADVWVKLMSRFLYRVSTEGELDFGRRK